MYQGTIAESAKDGEVATPLEAFVNFLAKHEDELSHVQKDDCAWIMFCFGAESAKEHGLTDTPFGNGPTIGKDQTVVSEAVAEAVNRRTAPDKGHYDT